MAEWVLAPIPTKEVTCSHCSVTTFIPGFQNWFLKDVGQCCIGLYPKNLKNPDPAMTLDELIRIYLEFMRTYETSTIEEDDEEEDDEDDYEKEDYEKEDYDEDEDEYDSASDEVDGADESIRNSDDYRNSIPSKKN